MMFGLQKLTLLDYPEKVACTVFCSGCNFRCPFCHNPALATGNESILDYSFSDIISFLESRNKKLDGICITGGEPLLYEETIELAERAKYMGFLVKIDTNGSNPERLRTVIEKRIADYIAMDIKNAPEKYEMTSGSKMLEQVKESVSYLLQDKVDYEFRTTVTGNLHTAADFEKIGKWIAGAKRYFLQKFVDSGSILNGNSEDFEVSLEKMKEYQKIVSDFIPSVMLRGI
ncbi:MAG: anaerobic ribonucleoside-triphosphate reductase activating protein [Lentisphaeria bacterium]|nr:anaerobic ribonucleoside-triphosphate reductase activating protein [Lentisphaeria bacterium]